MVHSMLNMTGNIINKQMDQGNPRLFMIVLMARDLHGVKHCVELNIQDLLVMKMIALLPLPDP